MSVLEPNEFEELLAAHANRELSGARRARLEELVAEDPQRAAAIAELEELHGWLDDERALRAGVLRPAEPGEELDETWRRLERAAGSAEEELRVRMMTAAPVPIVPLRGARRRLPMLVGSVAAIAAALIGWFVFFASSGAPDLFGERPADSRLGGPSRIVVVPEISASTPSFTWHAVPGARTYHVSVIDRGDNVLLQRAERIASSTTWNLKPAEFQILDQHDGVPRLRVVARDGAGIVVGSTGDLDIKVRRSAPSRR